MKQILNKRRAFCLFLLSFAFISPALPAVFRTDACIYHSQDDKSEGAASGYKKTEASLSRYLAYRDIPGFLKTYSKGNKALDYGAGTGISTEFLLKNGYDVASVDISQEMLKEARKNCPDGRFCQVENGKTPFENNTFDVVFSSLVLFEIGTKEEMQSYLEEAKRVLKKEGVLIALTGSHTMYSKDWLIFGVDFPENRSLRSGDLARVLLKDANIEFTDYYWTEEDYRRYFRDSGFDLIKVHYPLGKREEPYPWKDELKSSPFVIFVAKIKE